MSSWKVDIKLFRSNDHAHIEVRDTGIGISEDELDRLFERFFRASTAAVRLIQGTGLGLTIARAIAEAHGGTITVTSAKGAGTTFRIELPLAHAVSAWVSPVDSRRARVAV